MLEGARRPISRIRRHPCSAHPASGSGGNFYASARERKSKGRTMIPRNLKNQSSENDGHAQRGVGLPTLSREREEKQLLCVEEGPERKWSRRNDTSSYPSALGTNRESRSVICQFRKRARDARMKFRRKLDRLLDRSDDANPSRHFVKNRVLRKSRDKIVTSIDHCFFFKVNILKNRFIYPLFSENFQQINNF